MAEHSEAEELDLAELEHKWEDEKAAPLSQLVAESRQEHLEVARIARRGIDGDAELHEILGGSIASLLKAQRLALAALEQIDTRVRDLERRAL